MKILQINLNCDHDIPEESFQNASFSLYIFRSPIIMTINGSETAASGNSAIILGSSCHKRFRSLSKQKIKFDCIRFHPSPADKQYMSSIKLPINIPVRIKEEFTISSSVRAIKNNFIRQGKMTDDLLELYMKIIFITICESYISGTEQNIPLIPRYSELKKMRDLIYENPAAQWNVDDICLEIGISRTYFHRLYQQAFGITFLRDVIESRLLRGIELLTSTSLSVSAVAEKCGYENDSYFMRQFKKYKDCTPSEYRKKAANNPDGERN